MVSAGSAAALGSLSMLLLRDNDQTLAIGIGVVLGLVSTLWLLAALKGSIARIRDMQAGLDRLPPVTPVHERDVVSRPLGIRTVRTYGPNGADEMREVHVDLAWRSTANGGVIKRGVVPGAVRGQDLGSLRGDLKITDPDDGNARIDVLAKGSAPLRTADARERPIASRPARHEVGTARASIALGVAVLLGGTVLPATVDDARLPDLAFSSGPDASSDVDGAALADLDEMFEELIVMADEVSPGSGGLVRRLYASSDMDSVYGYFHDAQQGKDFYIRSDGGNAEYEADPTTSRGTIDLHGQDFPDFERMVLQVNDQVSYGMATAVYINGVDYQAPAGGEVDVELQFGTGGDYTTIHARMDGTVAPVWDPADVQASYAQTQAAAVALGVVPEAPQVLSLAFTGNGSSAELGLRSREVYVPASLSGSYGGYQLDLTDGSKWLTLTQEMGAFPEIQDLEVDGQPQLFALAEVSPAVLAEVVETNVGSSGAEVGDRPSYFLQVSRGITEDEAEHLDGAGIPVETLDVPVRILTGFSSLSGSTAVYRSDGSPDPGY